MNEIPIDPDVLSLLAELGAPAPVSAADLTAGELRQGMRDAIAIFTRDADAIAVHDVTDELVPGRGGTIPVRVYSPEKPSSVIVYLHGGAWISGDIDTHDLVTRRFSRDTAAVVVSVDYRMLPEHPFPAPIDDAYDAVVWARALQPDLPLLVAGDSAGGTLAACAALRARDEDGPRVDAQVLVYPGIDDNLETPSMLAFRDGPRISLEDLRFFFQQYASHEATLGSPYALPGRATSLAGLPPAVVAIAGHDLLRSAEEDYATRLRDAGVPVTVQLDPELVHGWIDFAPRVPSADRAFSRLTDSVNDLISRVTTPA
ncbi:alpha/beta hydrolase [Dactylosporangium sp. CA-233914]|uniref:alpha/beta hydrolase n=1 Tax=Dactylosporangium sp. CA-233914 TaxID=3239934 RepID=UPI003D908D3D